MAARRVNMSDLFGAKMPEPETSEQQAGPEERLIYVRTERLLPNPHNPREDLGDLQDLRSIAEIQRQSLLVVDRAAYLALYPEEAEACRGIDYVVVNGCRRHAAAVKWGREQLACAVNDSVAATRASLARAAYDENVERRDFDPIEEARAVANVVAEYPTAKEAAQAEGWSQTWISERKSLLKIHPDLQRQVRAKARGEEGGLAINVARRLGSVKGIEAMTLAQQVEALDGLLRADAEASEAKKEARRKVRQAKATTVPAERAAAGFSAENSGGAARPGAEFSAENSGGAPLPDQRTAPTDAAGPAAELASGVAQLQAIVSRLESRGLVAAGDAEAIRELIATLRLPEAPAEAEPVLDPGEARRYLVRLACGDTIGRDFPPMDPTTTCLTHGRQDVLGYDDTGLTAR